MNRREFSKKTAGVAIGAGIALAIPSCVTTQEEENGPFFKISLAQWSLHRTIRSGKLTTLDFPAKTKKDFGINAVEYVNQFFKDQAKDQIFLKELKQRTSDLDVQNLLIMIDAEGHLGDLDEVKRLEAVENHYKWVEAAQFLGCHSIRVNAAGEGTKEEVAGAATKSLSELSTFAKDYSINIIVENHGSYSSHGDWLSGVIKNVGLDNCGTLPDFGNFYEYDRYQGVKDMMPYAKGVSAKSHNFDAQGNETATDYSKMLQIVKDGGYTGHIGIEYEGPNENEDQGILATKQLLLNAGSLIS